MNDRVAQARKDVQQVFSDTVSWLDADPAGSLYAIERDLWCRLLVLGRNLLALFWLDVRRRPELSSTSTLATCTGSRARGRVRLALDSESSRSRGRSAACGTSPSLPATSLSIGSSVSVPGSVWAWSRR